MKDPNENQERHGVRNTAAALSGAAQGLQEGLQEEHLIDETKRAIRNTGALTRAVLTESQKQWGSPEMRQLREDTKATAGNVRASGSQATVRLREQGMQVQHRMQERVHNVQEQIEHGVQGAMETSERWAREGREKAQAVGETTRRGVRAPGHLAHDLKEATGSYVSSMTKGIGLFAGAGVLGATALVVLTIGLVVGINALLGAPAGHFITVLAYLVVAGVLALVAKRQRTTKREEAQEHVEEARQEIRHVTRPVRTAFNDHDRRGETHGTNGNDDRTRKTAPQEPRTTRRTTGES